MPEDDINMDEIWANIADIPNAVTPLDTTFEDNQISQELDSGVSAAQSAWNNFLNNTVGDVEVFGR